MSVVSARAHSPIEEERLKDIYLRYFKAVIVRDEAELAAKYSGFAVIWG